MALGERCHQHSQRVEGRDGWHEDVTARLFGAKFSPGELGVVMCLSLLAIVKVR
jgi:hypothetical protein